jgi:GNAT superfamily N-acetyltransferase
MALRELTDHEAITAALADAVSDDPVRNTMFGTLGRQLEDTAWAVVDGSRIAVRTATRFPVVLGGGWLGALDELGEVLVRLDGLAGLNGPEPAVAPLVARLRGDRPVRRMAQRLFRLDELAWPAGVPGAGRVATEADRDLVAGLIGGFDAEEGWLGRDVQVFTDAVVAEQGGWLWCDASGAAASLACRRPAAGGSARIGPVYTPPEHRGRGYGSAATAAATRSVLHEGAIPVLFTDLANPTSNKIYQLLGYRPVEDRVVVTFA